MRYMVLAIKLIKKLEQPTFVALGNVKNSISLASKENLSWAGYYLLSFYYQSADSRKQNDAKTEATGGRGERKLDKRWRKRVVKVIQ